MKKITKITSAVLMLILVMSIATTAFAATGTTVKPGDMTGESKTDVSGITGIGNSVIKIVSTIGIVVSVVVLVVLGIKYMLGSAEEKAEYKKTMLPYLIGAALVFAASAIATVIYNFM